MTILITGASGRTSGFVIRALLESGSVKPSDLRLFVRSQESIKTLQERHPQLSSASFAIGDLLEGSTLAPALAGVDVVFHNAPGFHALESAMGIALIDAAKRAGVKHFVYCGVLFPILTKMVNHKAKFLVEEHLVESGLDFTILQPTSLMQNISLDEAVSTGTLTAFYTPTVLQGYLDLEDLAAVARLVILDPSPHTRARYELVGQNCTYEDIAREITAQTGKQVKVEHVQREKVLGVYAAHLHLTTPYGVEGLDRMLYYYDRRWMDLSLGEGSLTNGLACRGIPGNSNTVRWLLGREPTSWAGRISRDLRLK